MIHIHRNQSRRTSEETNDEQQLKTGMERRRRRNYPAQQPRERIQKGSSAGEEGKRRGRAQGWVGGGETANDPLEGLPPRLYISSPYPPIIALPRAMLLPPRFYYFKLAPRSEEEEK